MTTYRDLFDYGLSFFVEMITKDKADEILNIELKENKIDIDKIIDLLGFDVVETSFTSADFDFYEVQDDTDTIYINTDEEVNTEIVKTVEMIYNLYYFKFMAEELAKGKSLEDVILEFASLSDSFTLSFLLPDNLIEKIIKENLNKERKQAIKDETGLPEDFIERRLSIYEDSRTKR